MEEETLTPTAEETEIPGKSYFWIFMLIIIFVAVVIGYLMFGRGPNIQEPPVNEETLECIANNSMLIVKEGCPACANQKAILGNLSKFTIIDIMDQPDIWKVYGFDVIPTWIINNQTYEKFRTIEELKNLTGC